MPTPKTTAQLAVELAMATETADRLKLLRAIGGIVLNRRHAIPAIVGMLRCGDSRVVTAALRLLDPREFPVGAAGMDALVGVITNPAMSDAIHYTAANLLSDCPGIDAAVVERLLPVFNTTKSRGARQCLAACIALSGSAGLNLLLDRMEKWPTIVAEGFAKVGPAGLAVIDRISGFATHRKPAVRRGAVTIIGTLSAADPKAHEALAWVLENPAEKQEVHEAAVLACMHLNHYGRSPRVRGALLNYLTVTLAVRGPGDHYEKFFFTSALQDQGPDSLADLDALAGHGNATVRMMAQAGIAAIHQRTGRRGFREYDTSYEFRSIRQNFLAEQDTTEMQPDPRDHGTPAPPAHSPATPESEADLAARITRGLNDPDGEVRAMTASWMRGLPHGHAVDDPSPRIRDQAVANTLIRLVEAAADGLEAGPFIEALGELDADLAGVLDCLADRLEHPEERQRWHAVLAAEAIGPGATPLLQLLRVLTLGRFGGEDPDWFNRFDCRGYAIRAIATIVAEPEGTAPLPLHDEARKPLLTMARNLPPDFDLNAVKRWGEAVDSLVRNHALTPTVVDTLVAGLAANDLHIRHQAVKGLASPAGLAYPQAAPALTAHSSKERESLVMRELWNLILKVVREHPEYRAAFAPLAAKLPAHYNTYPAETAAIMLWLRPGDEAATDTLLDALRENDIHIPCFTGLVEATLRAEPMLRRTLTHKRVFHLRVPQAAAALAEAGLFDADIRAGLEAGIYERQFGALLERVTSGA